MQQQVVSHNEWMKTHTQFLAREKQLTRLRDDIASERRGLPAELVAKDYQFANAEGKHGLGDLFQGSSQLVVYHFMLGAGWAEGCPSCSFIADQFDNIRPHLLARDINLVAVSRAPWTEIERFQTRMGWQFPWYSSNGTDFNFDFNQSSTRWRSGPWT